MGRLGWSPSLSTSGQKLIGFCDTLVRSQWWYYNHMANWRFEELIVICPTVPVAKLRCPTWQQTPDGFGGGVCFETNASTAALPIKIPCPSNRWLRPTISGLIFIQVTQQGEKYRRSNQRTKLYLRMPNSLLNSSILAIYSLWKSSEIVLLTNVTNHSQNLYYSAI